MGIPQIGYPDNDGSMRESHAEQDDHLSRVIDLRILERENCVSGDQWTGIHCLNSTWYTNRSTGGIRSAILCATVCCRHHGPWSLGLSSPAGTMRFRL